MGPPASVIKSKFACFHSQCKGSTMCSNVRLEGGARRWTVFAWHHSWSGGQHLSSRVCFDLHALGRTQDGSSDADLSPAPRFELGTRRVTAVRCQASLGGSARGLHHTPALCFDVTWMPRRMVALLGLFAALSSRTVSADPSPGRGDAAGRAGRQAAGAPRGCAALYNSPLHRGWPSRTPRSGAVV